MRSQTARSSQNLAQDEKQLKKCAKALGIDTSDDAEFPHQREMAKVIGAWRQAKAQIEVKTAADAAARAHGEPVTILTVDWNSLMEKFRLAFGPDLCDNELPAKSYYEEFEESLAEGCLEVERLCEVVSEEEAQDQRKVKADPARQYGMHLDGKLTLRTRRKFTSVEPTNQEQLRAKYTVLQNMWLLAQLRQPPHLRSTFDDHLGILLNRKNFNYRKEVDGQLLAQPCWSHFLSYEQEIRKDAYKLCRLQSIGITAALRQVLSDNEHRTQHWVQLIAIANSSGANDAKIARLEKQVEELQSASHRSRSPRMRSRQRALPQPKMLALPASASSSSQPMVLTASQNKRKQRAGRGKGSKGKGSGGKSSGKGKGVMSFEKIMDTLGQNQAFAMFHPSHKEMCFKFQKGMCMDASVCGRKHSCVGCGAEGKPYNFRHCLQSKLN